MITDCLADLAIRGDAGRSLTKHIFVEGGIIAIESYTMKVK